MKDPISEKVRRFITLYVDSVELLDVLLLLHRFPERSFEVEQISQELRSSHSAIQKRLKDLYGRKVLQAQVDQQHRYAPKSEDIASAIDELAGHYQTYTNRIIELIFSKQSEAIRSFADAFRMKKDED
jgi:predicted transcriptional regulator